MVYSYTPTYYSTLHDSITSICKTILPFSFKKRRLPAIAAAEQRLSKQQSDNLKWQQESFHQIHNLMGLCKEGILPESEVLAFRSHLLDTLIAGPADYEHPTILKDKLIFLQELLYAKCISEDEYHSSKRPLLQRLAVQGAEIDSKDIIVWAKKECPDEEWSVIDLRDEKCLHSKESSSSKDKQKHAGSAIKQIKGAASVFGFVSPNKYGKIKEEKVVNEFNGENHALKDKKVPSNTKRNELGVSTENPFWNTNMRGNKDSETKSILMAESIVDESMKPEKQSVGGDKRKKKPFRNLFQREQKDGHGGGGGGGGSEPLDSDVEEKAKLGKKQWGYWKKNDSEDETAPLSLCEKSDEEPYLGRLVTNPVAEGPDTKQIKRKLHPEGAPSDFFIDKVLGENIKKELSRIQTELGAKCSNVQFTDDQIEAISTRLPVDKADLTKFFPKTWCDQYGKVVLDVVKKEFKDHVQEMGNNTSGVARGTNNSKRWTTFDDDENCHPNLFTNEEHSFFVKQGKNDHVFAKQW